MLTADLVRTTRRKDQLFVRPLKAKAREDALDIANQYVEVFKNSDGVARDELEARLAVVEVSGHSQRVAAGLRKLLFDRADFTVPDGPEAINVRAEVFQRATVARREATREAPFVREDVLRESALELGVSLEAIEDALYSDLQERPAINSLQSNLRCRSGRSVPAFSVSGRPTACLGRGCSRQFCERGGRS